MIVDFVKGLSNLVVLNTLILQIFRQICMVCCDDVLARSCLFGMQFVDGLIYGTYICIKLSCMILLMDSKEKYANVKNILQFPPYFIFLMVHSIPSSRVLTNTILQTAGISMYSEAFFLVRLVTQQSQLSGCDRFGLG